MLGAGGGARAVVYGLIREGFQRVIVFNRHLHRAEGLVKHFGRSAAHMELRAMPWHESIIESELAKTKVLVNATSIGLDGRRLAGPGRDPPPGAARARPDLREDPAAARRRGGGLRRRRTASRCCSTRARRRSRCGPGQPAPLEVMGAALADARARACARPRASRRRTPGADPAAEPAAG